MTDLGFSSQVCSVGQRKKKHASCMGDRRRRRPVSARLNTCRASRAAADWRARAGGHKGIRARAEGLAGKWSMSKVLDFQGGQCPRWWVTRCATIPTYMKNLNASMKPESKVESESRVAPAGHRHHRRVATVGQLGKGREGRGRSSLHATAVGYSLGPWWSASVCTHRCAGSTLRSGAV